MRFRAAKPGVIVPREGKIVTGAFCRKGKCADAGRVARGGLGGAEGLMKGWRDGEFTQRLQARQGAFMRRGGTEWADVSLITIMKLKAEKARGSSAIS